jgi:hypothetical protein
MNKERALAIFLFLILALTFRLTAQFTPEEVAERAKWEEFLAMAEIKGEEQIKKDAVTNPWKLTLEKDGVTRNAAWKNPEGRMKGYLEGWKYEIAAYLFDKYLGLNMVPPTIERRFHENRGSLQLWVESEMSLKTKNDKKIPTPSYKVFYWNRATYLHRFFDNLISNEDRHANNILITKDWRLLLIDHSRSFRSSGKFTKDLIYTEKHPEGPKLMRELPRAMVEKIKALNFDVIKGFVGEYLTDDEINAVLTRRDLMLKEIEKLIQKFGEESVLY